MIVLSDIFVKYGDRVLLNKINLVIKDRDKIGLIGRNGAGKTTLLKILGKVESSDSGNINYPNNTKIGYLKQEIDFTLDKSILEETMTCFTEVKTLENEVEKINEQLAIRTDYESDAYSVLIDNLSNYSERLNLLGSGNLEGQAVKVLNGLGFPVSQLNDGITTLSGGWKMRIELAKLLLIQPDLLLLDEPTNHLDIESIIWLEEYLILYPGTVIVISHDERFLDNVCKRIIEIELGNTIDIKGNYTNYIKEKQLQREVLESSYANQQKAIAQRERTITRFMAKATKTKMAQSMKKQLDKMERIEILDADTSSIKLRFPEVPRSARIMLDAKNLTKDFGSKQVLADLNMQIERGEKIAFVGQNGQGKTTLAKILIGILEPSQGVVEKGENVFLSYYAQNQTDLLDPKQTVLEVAEDAAPPELRTKVRSILGSFLFSGEDADKKVSILSGGEKSRLALACMIMHPSNLIVLDEPTNHLDIAAKNILREALISYGGSIIVVSHDRAFLNKLTDKVFEFKDRKIKEYIGDIEYYMEKRKVSDIREIEKTTTDNVIKKATPNRQQTDNREEIKKVEKKIKYSERDIENIEKKIKEISKFLSNSQEYESEDYINKGKEYKSLNEDLKSKMGEWEKYVEKLSQLS